MRAGTRIEVAGVDINFRPTWEAARIARRSKACEPMPSGYHRVRFSDGGTLLIHEQSIRVTDNRGA